MRNRWNLLLGVFSAVCMLSGCTAEYLQPEASNADGPVLAGAEGDPHPALDNVCQSMDTIFLIGEDGSSNINKCYTPAGPCNCPPGQMKWGYVIMREGYQAGTGYIDCEFTMAPGWYGQSTTWKAGAGSSFALDGNGLPMAAGDWSTISTNPLENRWILRFPTNSIQGTNFDIAMKVEGVRLNLSGSLTEGSTTTLWARNPHYDDPASPNFSNVSSLLTRFTPQRCNETLPVDEVCTVLYTGVPALPTCKTIAATTSGLTGTLTYQWSTGATTPTITVCPTTTTTYTVTVTSNGVAVHVNEVTVNVLNVACGNNSGNGNGNNGGGGNGGNGNGNCGNGGGWNGGGGNGGGNGNGNCGNGGGNNGGGGGGNCGNGGGNGGGNGNGNCGNGGNNGGGWNGGGGNGNGNCGNGGNNGGGGNGNCGNGGGWNGGGNGNSNCGNGGNNGGGWNGGGGNGNGNCGNGGNNGGGGNGNCGNGGNNGGGNGGNGNCGNGNNPNHKVRVCHLPPGNPNNQQDICIDWSGVPAHVQEFRPAGSNQGHNSGCRIGPCSYNPCL